MDTRFQANRFVLRRHEKRRRRDYSQHAREIDLDLVFFSLRLYPFSPFNVLLQDQERERWSLFWFLGGFLWFLVVFGVHHGQRKGKERERYRYKFLSPEALFFDRSNTAQLLPFLFKIFVPCEYSEQEPFGALWGNRVRTQTGSLAPFFFFLGLGSVDVCGPLMDGWMDGRLEDWD